MATQVTAADLKTMTAEQIVQAHQDGRLEALLTGIPVNDINDRMAAAAAASGTIDPLVARIDGPNEPGAHNQH